jgi:hypothetical protein
VLSSGAKWNEVLVAVVDVVAVVNVEPDGELSCVVEPLAVVEDTIVLLPSTTDLLVVDTAVSANGVGKGVGSGVGAGVG